MKNINVLIFTAYYLPGYKGGGPIKTIKNLIDHTSYSLSYKVVTLDRDLGDASAYTNIKLNSWNDLGYSQVFYSQMGFSGIKQIFGLLTKENYDVVYLNSFFSAKFSFFPLLLSKILKQQVILGPRGEFSEGALSLKAQKKLMFIKLYKSLRLHHGTIFQASSDYEAEDIRKVLGREVDIYIAEDIGAQEFTEALPVRTSNILKAVFVSRISPKKNVLAALEMLQEVKQPVSYHIYGPVEDNDYWDKCEAVIETLPSHVKVEYKGELRPEEVINILSLYDLFFMPTKGENYGHVIAEALCAGLPLLIADTTPWRNLQEQGIGWDLSLTNPEAFSKVIDKLAIIPSEDHHNMRETVLAWAKNKFNQRDAIDANIAMFKYAANK